MSKGFKQERKAPEYPRSIKAFGQRFEPTTWYVSIFMLGFVGYLLFTRQQYWSIAIPAIMFLISAWLSKKQLRHWQNSLPKTEPGDGVPEIIMDEHSSVRRMNIGRMIEERAMASYGIQRDLTWGEYMRRKIMIAGLTEIPFHVQSRLRTLDRYQVSAFRADLVEDYDFQEAKTTVELYLNLHRIETESNLAVNRFEQSMMPDSGASRLDRQ